MSHTISARKPEGFKVEVFGWDGAIAHSGWYPTRMGAQEAAEYHERLVTLAGQSNAPTLDDIFAEMTDDDLLMELLG